MGTGGDVGESLESEGSAGWEAQGAWAGWTERGSGMRGCGDREGAGPGPPVSGAGLHRVL
jgi:hypothetical protein